jgi:hypothetical protein
MQIEKRSQRERSNIREDHPEIFESEEYLTKARKTRRTFYLNHKERWVMTPEKKERANMLDRKRMASSEKLRIKHREAAKAWIKANPKKVKERRLKTYGITLEQFEKLLIEQNGECAICGYSDMSNPKIFPFVDHCHKLNHVRGTTVLLLQLRYGTHERQPCTSQESG